MFSTKFIRVLSLTLVASALAIGCNSKKSTSGSEAKAGKAVDQGKTLPAEQGQAKSDQDMVQQLQGSEWQLDKEEKMVVGQEQSQQQDEGKQEQEQEQGGKEEQLQLVEEPKLAEETKLVEEPKLEQSQEQAQVEEKLAEQIQEEKVVEQIVDGKQESVKEIYPKTVKFDDSKTVTINDKLQGEFKVEDGELKIETPKAEEKLQVEGGKVQIQDNKMTWTKEQVDEAGTTHMVWSFRRIR